MVIQWIVPFKALNVTKKHKIGILLALNLDFLENNYIVLLQNFIKYKYEWLLLKL